MFKIKPAMLLATMLSVATMLLAPTNASATVQGLDKLVNDSSGKCMTVYGGNVNVGTNMVQNTCVTSHSQEFQVDTVPGDSSRFYFRSKLNTSRCIGIWQSSLQNGAYAAVMDCGPSATKFQYFQGLSGGGSHFKIQNVNSGKCLQVNNASSAEFAYISQFDCTAHDGNGDYNEHYFWNYVWVNWS